nr:type II toxin-antitoxin system RelE/ParE family toxin [Ferrimicrobium acidiphilum]
MSRYSVSYLRRADKELDKLPSKLARHIVQEIQTLKENPRGSNCKPLKGFHGVWRLRVGDYRVIYSIKDEQLLVLVVEVGHRREVYRGF